MTTYTKFKEYIWLVNTIYKARRITLAEINERWLKTDMSEGVEMARTTFYRHKCAIEDIFGIYIECDKKNGNKYYIDFFADCYGVVVNGDKQVERIVLRAYGREAYALLDLPIHHSHISCITQPVHG